MRLPQQERPRGEQAGPPAGDVVRARDGLGGLRADDRERALESVDVEPLAGDLAERTGRTARRERAVRQRRQTEPGTRRRPPCARPSARWPPAGRRSRTAASTAGSRCRSSAPSSATRGRCRPTIWLEPPPTSQTATTPSRRRRGRARPRRRAAPRPRRTGAGRAPGRWTIRSASSAPFDAWRPGDVIRTATSAAPADARPGGRTRRRSRRSRRSSPPEAVRDARSPRRAESSAVPRAIRSTPAPRRSATSSLTVFDPTSITPTLMLHVTHGDSAGRSGDGR